MERLWTFRTTNFLVALDCEPERDPDLSWDETGETAEKIESGEWVNVTFAVRVYAHGQEVGTDYLGNSIYADPNDFRKEHIIMAERYGDKSRDTLHTARGSYFTDMVREAIAEARKELADLRTIYVRLAS